MISNFSSIPLQLDEKIKKEGIIQSFVKDKRTNCIIIKFNHKYEQNKVVVPLDIVNKDGGWIKFLVLIKKRLNAKGVSKHHIELIQDTLDNNYELVVDLLEPNDISEVSKNNDNDENNKTSDTYQSISESKPENSTSFNEWATKLIEKYIALQKEILNLIPELWEPIEFALSVRSILRITNITLPFAGIILGPPGSLKTAVIESFRNTKDSQYSDYFSAKSFVSHNTSVPREKLGEVDLLPKIKDRLFLTPELSPTFSKKDEELQEILGIITRILDGHGYESDTGAHGHRGYNGEHMFVWIGAAVDLPKKVHRLLGTLGPKLYFYRIKTNKKSDEFYLKQIQDEDTKGDYNQKFENIKLKLNAYLEWVDLKPDYNEEKETNDNKEVLLYIIRLAILLSHLRGDVPVWETKDSQGSDYAYTFPTIEEPNRAITQLKNLARGHALSLGRNFITINDVPLLIKVVLSTASKERVILFDHLLENNGKLDTLSISEHMIVSKKTALKTMTELVILQVVDRLNLENNNENNFNNNAFQIQLKQEFNWFLSDKFKKLRANFGKEYYNEYKERKDEKKESIEK